MSIVNKVGKKPSNSQLILPTNTRKRKMRSERTKGLFKELKRIRK